MRGRKPLPTADKIARGNPGKRKLNLDEPEFAPSSHSPPSNLTGRALEIWNDLAKGLIDAGVLTVNDRLQLVLYCRTVGDAEQIREELARLGLRSKAARFLRIDLRKLEAQQIKIAAEIGMTPVSRSRVKVVKKPVAGDAKRKRFFGLRKVP